MKNCCPSGVKDKLTKNLSQSFSFLKFNLAEFDLTDEKSMFAKSCNKLLFFIKKKLKKIKLKKLIKILKKLKSKKIKNLQNKKN